MGYTQGEAVFQAVCEVIGGEPGGKVELREDELKKVHALVFSFFKTGATSHSKNPTDEQLLKYIPGLVNNWVRKDPRLNGGTKYQTKKPGSRSGSGDESIKAMRTLLSMTNDPSAKQAIQAEIDKRVATLKPKQEVNVSALPESLRHLVPN
jgi:hypothetical protein